MNEELTQEETMEETMMAQLMGPLERLLESTGADAVFGSAKRRGDVTVIPVAETWLGLGFGFGSGSGPASKSGDEGAELEIDGEDGFEASTDDAAATPTEDTASGSGGGGGGGAKTRPIGYIRITDDEVTFEPIVDQSRIALAGIAMSAWSVLWGALAIKAIANAIGSRATE